MGGEDVSGPKEAAEFRLEPGAGSFRVASVSGAASVCQKLEVAKASLCSAGAHSAASPACAAVMRAYGNGCGGAPPAQQALKIQLGASNPASEAAMGVSASIVDQPRKAADQAQAESAGADATNKAVDQQDSSAGTTIAVADETDSTAKDADEAPAKVPKSPAQPKPTLKERSTRAELAKLQKEARDLSVKQIKEKGTQEMRQNNERNDLVREEFELRAVQRETSHRLQNKDVHNDLSRPLTKAVSATVYAEHSSAAAVGATLDVLGAVPLHETSDDVVNLAERVKSEINSAMDDKKTTLVIQQKVGREQIRQEKADMLATEAQQDRRKANADARELVNDKKKLSKAAFNSVAEKVNKEKEKAKIETEKQKAAMEKMDKQQKQFERQQREKEAQEKLTEQALAKAKEKSKEAESLVQDDPTLQMEVTPPPNAKVLAPTLDLDSVNEEVASNSTNSTNSTELGSDGEDAAKNDPKHSPQPPIEGERPTYDEAKDQMAPAACMDTKLIAGSPDMCMSNIPKATSHPSSRKVCY